MNAAHLRSLALLVACSAALVPDASIATTGSSEGNGGGEGSSQFTGLAQAASANLFTGALGTAVPILVPPARKNASPTIALSYSSASGDGPFGRGWSIPGGAIERSTKFGVPQCRGDHTTNEFVLSLPSSSVELVWIAADGVYRAKTDEGYLEVEVDTTGNTWTLRDRSGMQYRFGDDPSARVFADADVFMDASAACDFTSVWALTEVRDPYGNTIEYVYEKDGNVLYPSEILYGGNRNANGQLVVPHPFRVRFETSARPRARTTYGRGVAETLARKVDAIVVEYRQDTSASYQPVRTYTLGYTTSATADHLLLDSVSLPGVPMQTFDYASNEIGVAQTFVYTPPALPSNRQDFVREWDEGRKVTRSVMDMNGDGRLDLVDVDTANQIGSDDWAVYPGLPGGGFASTPIAWDTSLLPTAWRESMQRTNAAASGEVQKFRVDTLDLTGDGLPDFVDAFNTWSSASPYWAVYPGYCTSATECGFGAAIEWWAPEKELRQGPASWTSKDLIDLNGDGRADQVVVTGTAGPWEVYWNEGNGFATSPATTFTASGYLHRVSAHETTIAHFDFNGDGLPDRVTSPDDQLAAVDSGGNVVAIIDEFPACRIAVSPALTDTTSCPSPPGTATYAAFVAVYPNTGQGFAAQASYSALQAPGVRLNESNRVRTDFADVNGDGLPDYLVTGPYDGVSSSPPWRVALNRGDGTLERPVVITGQSPPDSIAFPRAFVDALGSEMTGFARQTPLIGDDGRTDIELFDWNGDGLLDRVDTRAGSTWTVTLSGNLDDEVLARPLVLVHSDDGARGEMFAEYEPASQGDHGGADGAPDLPAPPWVVSAIRRTSGLCSAAPTGPDLFDPADNPCIGLGLESVQYYEYEGGLFDPASREFRGFRTVTERAPDGSRNETTFSQDDHTRGKVESVETFARDLAEVVRRATNVWQTKTASLDSLRTQVFLAESRTETFAIPHGSGPSQCVVNRNTPPDDYGRFALTCSLDCAGAPATPASCANPTAGQVETATQWASPTGASAQPVLDRASQVETRWYPPQPGGGAGAVAVLARKSLAYDGLAAGSVSLGSLTSARDYRDQSPLGAPVDPVTATTYDAVGNVLTRETRDASMTPGTGEITTFAYSDALFRLYPTVVTLPSTGTVAHATTTVTDLRYGQPTRITDENGQSTDRTYDALGRVLCEAGPLHDIAGCGGGSFTHSVDYQYLYADPSPSASFMARHFRVRVRKRSDGGAPIEALALSDALGRQRLQEVDQVIGGSSASVSKVVRGQVAYDANGRAVARYAPYVAPAVDPQLSSPPSAATVADFALNGLQSGGSAVLDPLSRVHRVTPPDGNAITMFYEGRKTRTVDPLGNTTTSHIDFMGNEIARELYDQASPTTPSMRFAHTYDGLSRLLTTTVANDPLTTVARSYDTLGNLVRLDDPDSGTWKFGYDHRSNLVYEDSPRPNLHVQATYDALSRRRLRCTYSSDAHVATSEASCGSGGAQESAYTYDQGAFGAGRRTGVVDLSGSESTAYDARGRPVWMTKTIAGVQATVAYTYDLSDRVIATEYPDGEVVTTGYNAVGNPVSLASDDATVYLADTEFDLFGRATTLVRGNGVTDSFTFYDESESYRLERIAVEGPGAATVLDLTFGYEDRAKVASIADGKDPFGALTNQGTYEYDGLGRLTRYTRNDATPATVSDYAHSAYGNLTKRAGQVLTYGDASRPHRATKHRPTGDLQYREDGSRWLKMDWGSFPWGPLGTWNTYAYDALGRMTSVTSGQGTFNPIVTVDYSYDHAGRRVKAVDSLFGGTQRYFGDLAESREGSLVKYYAVGGLRVASREVGAVEFSETPLGTLQRFVWRVPPELTAALLAVTLALLAAATAARRRAVAGLARAGAGIVLALFVTLPSGLLVANPSQAQGVDILRHFHVDHLGSTQAITNASGALVYQIRYTPYGRVRGRYTGSGASAPLDTRVQQEFTGHETEFFSGIVYAGARHYDPELGQFLSHDPVRQYASPYAYGPGDPVNGTDPSGACFGVCETLAVIGTTLSTLAMVASEIALTIRSWETYKATGSAAQGAKAYALGHGLSQTSSGLSFGLSMIPYVGWVLAIAAIGYGVYQTVDAAQSGDVVGAVAAGVGVLAGIAGVAGAISRSQASSGGASEATGVVGDGSDANGAATGGGQVVDDLDLRQEAFNDGLARAKARQGGLRGVAVEFVNKFAVAFVKTAGNMSLVDEDSLLTFDTFDDAQRFTEITGTTHIKGLSKFGSLLATVFALGVSSRHTFSLGAPSLARPHQFPSFGEGTEFVIFHEVAHATGVRSEVKANNFACGIVPC